MSKEENQDLENNASKEKGDENVEANENSENPENEKKEDKFFYNNYI